MAFYYLMSVAVWLVATVIVRLAGQYVFAPDRPLVIALAFLVTAPAMALFVQRLVAKQRDRAARLMACIAIAVPAMLLDVASLLAFSRVFPNLGEAVRGLFAAWLLWAYCAIFVTGLFTVMPRTATVR